MAATWIQSLAWEFPYTTGAAKKKKKKKKKQEIASKYTILNIAHLMHFNVFNQLYCPLKYVLRSTYKGIYAIKYKKIGHRE